MTFIFFCVVLSYSSKLAVERWSSSPFDRSNAPLEGLAIACLREGVAILVGGYQQVDSSATFEDGRVSPLCERWLVEYVAVCSSCAG